MQEKDIIMTTSEAVELVGTIESVDTTQVAADGPVEIIIDTDDGETAAITVPSMGLPLCAAAENIADVFELSSGERIEVRGVQDASGSITPCESADHYLRVQNGDSSSE